MDNQEDEYDKEERLEREAIAIKTKHIIKLVSFTILILFIIVTFFSSFALIDAGNVGVVTRMGAVNRVAQPGLVVKFPYIEDVVIMETRTQKEQVDASAASKDLQEVKSTVALNFHLDAPKAVDVYQTIGIEYKQRIIDPAIQEAFKATTAKFTAEELIVKREAVKQVALEQLRERLSHQNIIVDDFNIVNFDFSASFNKAIEEKQVAQQNVEREKRNLERIQVEAQQALAQAKGQADAQKALKDSGALSPEYLQYLALNEWNGILPTVVGGAIPFINVK